MAVERSAIEAAFSAFQEHRDKGDWNAWVDLFSEDCSFSGPFLSEPIRGRESLRSLAANFPKVSPQDEWVAIDGNRLVCGWTTRNDLMPSTAPSYRGVMTLVFDSSARIREFEEWFDTAQVHPAALGAVTNASS